MAEKKGTEFFQMINGEKSDRRLHEDVEDNADDSFMQRVNEMYRTNKKTKE